MRTYWVYILASKSRRLYVGVTNNIHARLEQHRAGKVSSTSRYRITRLVHIEGTGYVIAAIAREKELKGWSRAKRLALISEGNPAWDDLLPPS